MYTSLIFGFTLFLFMLVTRVFCQTEIPWQENYLLTFEDFQSSQTKINPSKTSFSIHSGSKIDFSFMMSSYEFMFTKNFNSKVKTSFIRKLATITAPDTLIANQLVQFARYDFDLQELYARKFRKELYEQKGAFSDASFFQPIFEQLHQEMIAENARVLDDSEFGANEEILKTEHQKVRIQILELRDFCMECKPSKKKK